MALKAEVPLMDYIEVSSSVLHFKEKKNMRAQPRLAVRAPHKRDRAQANLADQAEELGPNTAAGASREEADVSWKQEYLIGESSGHSRLVCMVCGGILSAPGPAAARKHILKHHAHSLDFSLEEKRNILEAWSEGVVLPTVESQSSVKGSPDKRKRPAEIEVLVDSEEQPSSRKRGHPKERIAETAARSDAKHRLQGRPRRHSSEGAKDAKSKEPGKVAGKEWLSECGVPGSAPAEIRIFTDGTFPAGFALKLYCHTQPEPPQASNAKPAPRRPTVDLNCSVSLLKLHPTVSSRRLRPGQDLPSCPLGQNPAQNCGARPSRRVAEASGKGEAALLSQRFNPVWRARFLMDFDDATGHLVCMVCEYPLQQVGLATVKQHILQCHAETLHLPREVRRTIREVWESRSQSSLEAPRK